MAWSWSYTSEAYENARANLDTKPREWLNDCLAEWHAAKPRPYAGFEHRPNRYHKHLAYAAALPADILADFIWERMEQNATCDNGGFDAWACPHGCHTVSFDCEEV